MPILFVTATAGAGKTTAVLRAAARAERPLAWLTLDDTDVAPGRLLAYLEAAIAQRIPEAEGAATSALAAGVPHREAAGLLAELAGEQPLLLVVDEIGRLAEAPAALSVLEALLRYWRPDARLVLVARREVPINVTRLMLTGKAGTVTEAELAFSVEEAAAALALSDRTGDDAERIVRATGGWATGVLFEAWRADGHLAGAGGEADPLHGYLSQNILDQLPDDEREFLVSTSILSVVTEARAEGLGLPYAAATLASLRTRHLPANWEDEPVAMRCHARFREYLRELLRRRGRGREVELLVAHAALLEREGHDEEAVEELLAAGRAELALAPAERAIVGVVERLDFAVAERWLAALAAVRPAWAPGLVTAELLLAVWRYDFRRGAEIGDDLAREALRDRYASSSNIGAALLGWSYYAASGRVEDALAVLAAAAPSPEIDTVGAMLTGASEEPVDPGWQPVLRGGPLDALVIGVDYHFGHVSQLARDPESMWAAKVGEPWRIGALRVVGQTTRALEVYERAAGDSALLTSMTGAELMRDLGREQEARELLAESMRHLSDGRSKALELVGRLVELRIDLRFDRDPASVAAKAVQLEREARDHRYVFILEQAQTWHGLALLLAGEAEEALRLLREAVASMTRSDRLLVLPMAGVYLAEAEWRAGDEERADACADAALAAAHRQGSNHMLLQALTRFPGVLSRRLDAEETAESEWHTLARALRARGLGRGWRIGPRIEVLEFGRVELVVDGAEVSPRLTKSHTLLAYLACRASGRATRTELVGALFERGTDDSTLAYLRQALRRAQEILPDGVSLQATGDYVALEPADALTSESLRFEHLLAEATAHSGLERLGLLQQALAAFDRGVFLPRVSAPWVDERRLRLEALAVDALFDAAEAAWQAGRCHDGEPLIRRALERNAFKESGWRLLMRIASALGADDTVIEAYRGCEAALAEIGAKPSPTTRKLLDQLRR